MNIDPTEFEDVEPVELPMTTAGTSEATSCLVPPIEPEDLEGLYTSLGMMVAGGEVELFYRHRATLNRHYAPRSPEEIELVDKIFSAEWRLRKIYAVESATVSVIVENAQTQQALMLKAVSKLPGICRMIGTIEKERREAIEELRAVQRIEAPTSEHPVGEASLEGGSLEEDRPSVISAPPAPPAPDLASIAHYPRHVRRRLQKQARKKAA